MKPKHVLTAAAIYLGVLGIGFMFFPRQIGIDAVPPDASPALIAYLRTLAGPFIGIAVLDWLTGQDPCTLLQHVKDRASARKLRLIAVACGRRLSGWFRPDLSLAALDGFACVTANDVWGVFGGGARPAAKLFLIVHLLMTLAFLAAWRSARHAR